MFYYFIYLFSVGKPIVPPPTSAPVVSKPATIVAPGATSRLVHPDEDISLVKTYLFLLASSYSSCYFFVLVIMEIAKCRFITYLGIPVYS